MNEGEPIEPDIATAGNRDPLEDALADAIYRALVGHRQRFCSTPCRRAYDTAGRRLIERWIADGRITLADLRADHDGAAAARALVPGGASPSALSEGAKSDLVNGRGVQAPAEGTVAAGMDSAPRPLGEAAQ